MITINISKTKIMATIVVILMAVAVVLILSLILMVCANPVFSYFGIKKLNFIISLLIVLAVIAITDDN